MRVIDMWLSFEITTRVVVGVFLFLAGVAKLSAGPAWRRLWLRAFRLVPPPLAGAIAFGVAVAEVSAGAVLLAGAGGGAGAAVAAGLLGLVTGAVAVSLLRGLRVPCGCLGRFGQLITWRIVARNLVLIAAVTALAVHGVTAGVGAFPWPAQAAVVAAVLAAAAAVSRRNRTRRRRHPVAGTPPGPAGEPGRQAGTPQAPAHQNPTAAHEEGRRHPVPEREPSP